MPAQWDSNKNDSAIEVVDENLKPRFQLIYKKQWIVLLNGIFQVPGAAVVLEEHAHRFVGSNEDSRWEIRRIFQYPSWKHKGELLPDTSSSANSPAVGTLTVQPGAAVSFGQQGGITAGIVNVNPIPPMPELTDSQRAILEHDLKEAGLHVVAVRFTQGNERSQYVADQFIELIKRSGWTLRRPKFLIEQHIARGIFILVDDGEPRPEAATVLENALKRCGLPPMVVAIAGLGKGDVDLAIGIQ